jgi:hypothetical protein
MNLRPMTLADADFMLTLKNYPETREFAILSHDEIKRDDHCKWLKNNVQFFQVIEDIFDGCAVIKLGAIRVQDDEISIWVSRENRNERVATDILKLVSYSGMKAKIVQGNIASLRAFIAAGFSPVEFIDNKYYLFLKP